MNSNSTQKVVSYLTKNKDFFKPWLPAYEDEYFSYEYNRQKIDYEYDEIRLGSMVKYWLFKKEDTDYETIIGDITYSYIIRGALWSCFLGYKIDMDNLGRGYAPESIKKVNEYLFNELMMHRIEANIIPRNIASIRVVEKLGFQNEGLSPKYLKINGVWEDHYHFVLLNPKVE